MTAESRVNRSTKDDAETIAIEGLSFLAERPEELQRFIALSGIEPANLRQCAADPAFLIGVLDFLLSDEALLLVFAEATGFPPQAIATARHRYDNGRNN